MNDLSLEGAHAFCTFMWDLVGVSPRSVKSEPSKGRTREALPTFEWAERPGSTHRIRFEPNR